MKRTSLILVLVVLVALFAASGCATTVSVRHLIPAETDMSAYRNLAVASTEPFSFGFFNRPSSIVPDYSGKSGLTVASGFGTFTELSIARYATTRLVQSLDRADYFTLLPPSQTDTIMKGKNLGFTISEMLMRNGVEALFTSSIDYLDVDEYIYAVEKNLLISKDPVTGNPINPPVSQKVIVYYLMQKVSLTYSYEIVDARTGKVIVSRTLHDSQERSFDLTGKPAKGYVAPSLEPMIEEMLQDLIDPVVQQIAPRWETTTLSLMKNEPERKNVAFAWEEVRRGNLAIALEAFKKEWNRSGHIPSGYNAALIMEAMGNLEQAIDLMEDVYQESGNNSIYSMLRRMRQRLQDQAEAEAQLLGQ